MKLLNVSFGLYAFLPQGWLFMAFVILAEAILMSLYLTRKIFNGLVYTSAVVSNVVSGLFGIIVSMVLNGGLWLDARISGMKSMFIALRRYGDWSSTILRH